MEERKTGMAFNFEVGRISFVLKGLIMAQIVLLAFSSQSWGAKANHDKVNCSKGQTITDALGKADGKPVTIEVSGVCIENVVIAQDDVTLVSYDSAGATVKSADPNQIVITVTGSRTVVNGLKVTDGWNGILVEGSAAITNTAVQNNIRDGINFRNGGRGKVDRCMIQYNGRHGIVLEGGNATVTASDISLNDGAGISATIGSSVKIGISYKPEYAGNTINQNGGSGIRITSGTSTQIGGNTISGNGRDPNSLFYRGGISVSNSSAALVGGNIITLNFGSGLLAAGSAVSIGSGESLGLPLILNEINGNSPAPTNDCDLRGIMGSSLEIAFVKIEHNTSNTPGLCLNRNSIARITGPTSIKDHSTGIELRLGGSLIIQQSPPNFDVSGNRIAGLNCSGTESHIEPFVKDGNGNIVIPGISGNISSNCTSF